MFIHPNASNFIDSMLKTIHDKYKLTGKKESRCIVRFDNKHLYISSSGSNASGYSEKFVGLFENDLTHYNVLIDNPIPKTICKYNEHHEGNFVFCKFAPSIDCNKLIDVQNGGIPLRINDEILSNKQIEFSEVWNKDMYILLHNVSKIDGDVVNSNRLWNNIITICNSIISIIQDDYYIDTVSVTNSDEEVSFAFQGHFSNNAERKIYINSNIPLTILESDKNIEIYNDTIDISGLEPYDYVTPEMRLFEETPGFIYNYKVDETENAIAIIPLSNIDSDTETQLIKDKYSIYCNKYAFDIEFIYHGYDDDIQSDISNNKYAKIIKFRLT